jgi:hypothetical protein
MKLEDFVAETLTSLASGVQIAQAGVASHGGKVNPYLGSAGATQVIQFDVELTTVEGRATEGGLGVFVGPVALGGRDKSDASSQSVGRIRFSVPVELPFHPR